jgi:hypothetical protein
MQPIGVAHIVAKYLRGVCRSLIVVCLQRPKDGLGHGSELLIMGKAFNESFSGFFVEERARSVAEKRERAANLVSTEDSLPEILRVLDSI